MNPSDDARPLMIWQWMDGLVTKDEPLLESGLIGPVTIITEDN